MVSSVNDGLLLVAGGVNASGAPVSSADFYGFARVKTDAFEYAPGTPVNITGGGFHPGETVTLHLEDSPYYDSHPDLTATVQADGTFSNSQFAPDIHDLKIGFHLTATGSDSGLQSQTVFADDSKPTVVVNGTGTGSGSVQSSDGTLTNCTITAGVVSGVCSHTYNATSDPITLTAPSSHGQWYVVRSRDQRRKLPGALIVDEHSG